MKWAIFVLFLVAVKCEAPFESELDELTQKLAPIERELKEIESTIESQEENYNADDNNDESFLDELDEEEKEKYFDEEGEEEEDEYSDTKEENDAEYSTTSNNKRGDGEANSIIDQIAKVNGNNNEDMTDIDIKVHHTNELSSDEVNEKRNAIFDRNKLWRTKDIPYVFSSDLDAGGRAAVKAAFQDISAASCLTFREKTANDKFYLRYFGTGGGCWSYVGFQTWPTNGQLISINNGGCGTKGIAIHETLHALGFYHEQSRYDRDQFVEIFWEYISPGMEGNFKKRTVSNSDNSGTAYDFDGVMHYSKYSFSTNGKPTILAIGNPSQKLGQRDGLSDIDKDQLYKLYDCTNTQKGWSNWSGWTPCSPTCQSKRERFCYSDNLDGSCSGSSRELKTCTDEDCKRDGHWGKWSMWSCDAPECASGTSTRSRQCDDPAPQKGGAYCPGDAKQARACRHGCPKSCDMEGIDDICGYKTVGPFAVTSGTTPSSYTGPPSSSSTYVYLEATNRKNGQTYTMTSKKFTDVGPQCYRFKYHMYSGRNTMGNFKVVLVQENQAEQQLFARSGNQGQQWFSQKLDIDPSGAFQIKYVLTNINDFASDIAFDDMFLDAGSCDGSTVTTTKATTSRSTSSSTTSTRQTTSTTTTTQATTPSTTSTRQSTTSSSTTRQPTTASTTSTTTSTRQSTTSSSTTQQPTTASTTSTRQSTSSSTASTSGPVATTGATGSTGGRTTGATGSTGGRTTGATASTSGPVTSTSSPTTTANTTVPGVEFACNFEHGLCGMEQSSNDKLDWTIRNGRTPSSRTGPGSDRSNELGKYAYLETSGKRTGDDAILSTGYGKLYGKEQCLEFFYHMWGGHMGSLVVTSESITGQESEMFRVEGNQGNEWKQALVPFSGVYGDHRINFKAIRGRGWQSDIAIDDIYIHSGACPMYATPTTLSCSFKESTCDWSVTGQFKWKRQRRNTPSYGTGPGPAVTGWQDYYIYAEASQPQTPYLSTYMESEFVESNDSMCMDFYFHMYGENMGSLSVEATTKDYKTSKLFAIQGNQGNKWHEASIELPVGHAYYLTMVAQLGDGVRSDIAVDNILVKPGQCERGIHSSYCDFESYCNVKLDQQSSKCNPKNVTDGNGNSYLSWKRSTCSNKEFAVLMNFDHLHSRGNCLSFKYMIQKATMCTVYVDEVYTVRGRTYRYRLGYFNDASENQWVNRKYSLRMKSASNAKVEIRVRKSSKCADFAVDQIEMVNGLC